MTTTPLCEIVRFNAPDGYIYSGLLFYSAEAKKTVIHVHGACGDFISFSSITTLAKHYQKNKINLLTFNLKGHDCIAEGYWVNGDFHYIGGSITEFNECIQDIESAIQFCLQFSSKIILQGHSMGCERVLTYQLEKQKYYDTILISPCDAYRLHELFLETEKVETQIEELRNCSPPEDSLILYDAYGIKNGNEKYPIPVNRKTLLSIMTGMPFKFFRLDKPIDFFLPIKSSVCIGQNDSLQTVPAEKMFQHLENKFTSLNKINLKADHEFKPEAEKLGLLLVEWIKTL